MMEPSAGSSPQGKTKATAFRAVGKQSKSTDDTMSMSNKGSTRRPPQPPVHVRALQQHKSQPDSLLRTKEQPEPPRRSKSTPTSSSHPLPSKHHTPLFSSSSFNPPSRHLDSQNGIQRHSQPSPTAKRPLVTMATQQPTQQLDPIKQKLVDRAIKARLYLLNQSGPNRFLVGGDAPDSRFHVTIGPQSCSCNRAHCVHLLFVMLRVLKVGQSDPMLWQRQLRNYEAESLLRELQARVTLRTTPRKSSKKRFDFSVWRSPDEGVRTSPMLLRKQEHKEETKERGTMEGAEAPDRLPLPELGVSDKSPVEVDSDKSDGEETEDVCPICLNELDEGEDLLVCSGCHNHLHQHCMDVWAGEEKRKGEEVHCPVCRAIWPYTTPITSPSTGPSIMPVSIPIGVCGHGSGEGGMLGGMRLKSVSPAYLSQVLSAEKSQLVERLKSIFGPGAIEEVFSTDWKARETALNYLSREAIGLLLPQLTSKTQVGLGGGGGEGSERVRGVQDVCMQVVAYSCSDSVLKVFLAALELMRVVLGYSVCYSEDNSLQLQSMLKPVLPVLLTRCADAQRRVKECSIDTMCNLSLGQEGPLSMGSACGQQSPYGVSDIRFVLESTLSGHNDTTLTSWRWWLGRMNFLDRLIARFTLEFLIEHCILVPPSPNGRFSDSDLTSGLTTPMDSITSLVSNPGPASMELRPDSVEDGMEPGPQEQNFESNVLDLIPKEEDSSNAVNPLVENNLLFQVWYFAAKATHITHNKLGKVARRVIIRVARVLKDQPSSLEIVHDVVEKCHRTQAEGLLDRVLRAREKPHESSKQKRETGDGNKSQKEEDVTPTEPRRRILAVEDTSFLQDVENSLRISTARHLPPPPPPSAEETPKEQKCKENESVASDDSFRSAASDFDLESARDRVRKESGELLEASSSTSNSHDSRTDDGLPSKSNGLSNVASGGNETWRGRLQPQYSRQTTADSLFSTDAEGSIDSGYVAQYQCKRRIEEEEAETEAKIRSLLPEDNPHPPLTGVMPPSAEVLIHMQSSGRAAVEEETTDSGSVPYLEGVHWVKGKLIGTGAFCTCSLARDVKNGTMFAVKQVSFVRNTKAQQEEELKRLREEIGMLGRMNHPNIVRCLGATQHEGHINIFIEWMAGGCLDQLLHDFGAFSESVVCRYVRQVIHGIVFLHENGIIHRDLKGGNILVDSTGQRVRIADFGAAARLASHTTDPGEFQDMEGTVAFMAPEVVRGGSFDDAGQSLSVGYGRRCDVWSIGCVIIQMTTAKPPWVGAYDVSNKYQLIFKIGNATSPPPYPDFLDPALKDLTIRCLEIKPEDRPTSSELLKHPIFTQS